MRRARKGAIYNKGKLFILNSKLKRRIGAQPQNAKGGVLRWFKRDTQSATEKTIFN